ncbi:MAG: lipopolysaccharide biosynthesis protein [Alistipes sp.]|nr:lipopolysaccharide biosynthesis protein [Alistipes sp.]
MLEKLVKQTAVYGISTIAVRFLSYLLTPFYTRVFSREVYGVITDVYALIPFALVLLTMGMESGYFRFAAKADEAGGDVRAAKQRLFRTVWGATTLAALLFFAAVALFRTQVSAWLGSELYTTHPEYAVWVAAIVLCDVCSSIPFSRLREQGRATTFMGLKAFCATVNVVLAFAFGFAGLYATRFGVGWVFVANLAASALTLLLLLRTTDGGAPRIEGRILRAVLLYSLPLLLSGIAGTANEFIDRQLIKFLAPAAAMDQVGLYGAIVKVGMVMALFTQIYRLAAEPFFLADYKKSDFVRMNAAALEYFVLVSMVIFLGVTLFKEAFALIVGRDFREGMHILPLVLGANVLAGVWLNLSFWYKREERTWLALVVTFTGLLVTVGANLALIPRWGYYGAAWARLICEAAMVAVSYRLNSKFYPIPYRTGRMIEYAVVALAFFGISRIAEGSPLPTAAQYLCKTLLLGGYICYAVRRAKIDVRGLLRSMLRRSGRKGGEA